MTDYFKKIIGLCIFKTKPQDLPLGREWIIIPAVLLLLLNLLTPNLSVGGKEVSSMSSLLNTLAQLVIEAGVVYLLLKMIKHTERWQQTITALFGVFTIFSLAVIPMTIKLASETDLTPESIAQHPVFLPVAFLGFWNLLTNAHILRNAMSCSFPKGVLLAFLVGIAPFVVVSLFF